jgi:hypothetical protein
MTSISRLVPIAFFLMIGSVPVIAAAQAPSPPQTALPSPPRLPESAKVWVITSDNQEHEGVVVSANASHFVVWTTTGSQSFPWASIRRVERPDPNWDGALMGAVPGALLMGLLGKATCGDCAPHSPTGTSETTVTAMFALLGAGAGAGLGALLDSLGGRRVVYRAPSAPRAQLTPFVAPSGVGMRASFAWGASRATPAR